MNKKTEELSVGSIVASAVFCFIVIISVICPPVSYYIGQWNSYWSVPSTPSFSYSTTSLTTMPTDYYDRDQECMNRATKYYHQPAATLWTLSSSTDSGYDCYGAKLNKIPE